MLTCFGDDGDKKFAALRSFSSPLPPAPVPPPSSSPSSLSLASASAISLASFLPASSACCFAFVCLSLNSISVSLARCCSHRSIRDCEREVSRCAMDLLRGEREREERQREKITGTIESGTNHWTLNSRRKKKRGRKEKLKNQKPK